MNLDTVLSSLQAPRPSLVIQNGLPFWTPSAAKLEGVIKRFKSISQTDEDEKVLAKELDIGFLPEVTNLQRYL